ncbi:MAG: 2-oxo acid dehydrogenase subunit E2 [Bacteroidales bacterium]|nr:2-oxo acid dehydrogenase subunit E2 [Bacteroidales bacterium]
MATFDIVMPKLGESIIEATITKWLKAAGDQVNEDDALAEIATDKVDSEIPSPVEGVVKELFFKEGDIVPVGKVIAVIDLGGEAATQEIKEEEKDAEPVKEEKPAEKEAKPAPAAPAKESDEAYAGDRFYSPLVKNIAEKENISLQELDKVPGSGKDGRLTKQDLLDYLQNRPSEEAAPEKSVAAKAVPSFEAPKVTTESGDEIYEMDRMRKLIADHMVMSKQVSPHVTSFIDVDVTAIVNWREKNKDAFFDREKEKLTYTHIFIEAAAQILKEFPRVNASVDGMNIIHRKKINIGMATALPNGNLIVPVIRNADQKNLLGIIKDVNDLANRARKNSLLPDEIQGGTFTVTNFGTFDSLTGTPIINQPQVAILGIGAIRKKPVVIETTQGDVIGIRHIMILSLAYDHRMVDGALGGMYLKRMKEMLEDWDSDRKI